MWSDFVQVFLVVFTGLFPVVNPPSSALIVLGMTSAASDSERRYLAGHVALYSVVLLSASIGIGAYVLAFFGVSVPVLRVAGGLVIAVTGWKLLQAPTTAANVSASTASDADGSLRDQLFYPFTLPITAGPGSIAVAVALGTGSPDQGPLPVHLAAVATALLALGLCLYLCMRYAGHLRKLLGSTGTQVTVRLLAFVILCIGVQLVWTGVSALLGPLLAAH